MIKPVRTPWTCSRCLRLLTQQRNSPRRYSSAVAAATSAKREEVLGLSPASRRSPDVAQDESVLRRIFDSESFWKSFNSQMHTSERPAGLFQNRYLTTADGFRAFAFATLEKCRKLVTRVVAASSVDEYRAVVRDMDRLSDLLCRVIDLSEFVRNTHPDQSIQGAATEAYAVMFEYMNVLNTTTELNDQLTRAMEIPEVVKAWTDEEKVVAEQLRRDFSKSAIDLPERSRHRFVELSNEISVVGTKFVDGMKPQQPVLSFNSRSLAGMDAEVLRGITVRGRANMFTVGASASMAMQNVHDPDVRRQIYLANRTASAESIQLLEQLLSSRAELAQLCGYDSFAHMSLSDKMARTPEAVERFLTALAADNHPGVQAELAEMLKLKKGDGRAGHAVGSSDRIDAWDRAYYASRVARDQRTHLSPQLPLSDFFSLGTVMRGLSRIFHRLYGIRLVPKATTPEEAWNDDVRRLDVMDDTLGHVGVIYCDLFERPGKSPNPSHFTLRCSRVIPLAEIAETAEEMASSDFTRTGSPHFESAEEAATDGMAAARDPRDGELHQLPTIALICDFTSKTRSVYASRTDQAPTLLSFREVHTLFHEMGHAAHSILGRTALQNVSGTRCATDLSELPSILFERFASTPAALRLFARHWRSGDGDQDEPLPTEFLADVRRAESAASAAENEAQILMALLDQRCHAIRPSRKGPAGVDSTRLYHEVWAQHGAVPEPAETAWQGFIGHLFGYGATYYAYLFDRAIAGRVWRKAFVGDERTVGTDAEDLDWAGGERFRDEVLRWGGGRDGWKCVAGVLRDERVAEGGEAAMAEVGRWGVAD